MFEYLLFMILLYFIYFSVNNKVDLDIFFNSNKQQNLFLVS